MSIIDEKKDKLDPTIWGRSADGSVVLREEVARAIRRKTRELVDGIPVRGAHLVGSITGYYYSPDSDLDINLVLDVSDELLLALRDRAKTKVNGQFVPGTKHPINFFVRNETPSLSAFDGVYDLKRDVWVKKPTDVGVDLFSIYDDFKQHLSELDAQIGEAWRSIIDLDKLKESLKYGGSREIYRKIKERLDDLDDAITSLVAEYDDVHQKRVEGFERQIELADRGLSPYPSLNVIPENIRYKVLERYHYVDFLKKLREVLESADGKIDTPQEVQDVRETLQMFPNKDHFAYGFITKALGGLRL